MKNGFTFDFLHCKRVDSKRLRSNKDVGKIEYNDPVHVAELPSLSASLITIVLPFKSIYIGAIYSLWLPRYPLHSKCTLPYKLCRPRSLLYTRIARGVRSILGSTVIIFQLIQLMAPMSVNLMKFYHEFDF